jgi:hypothetical protein
MTGNKCWRLSKPLSKIAFRYDNKKIDSYVHGYSVSPHYVNGKLKEVGKVWGITVNKNNVQKYFDYFKTRSQALSFANKYMKSHNSC